MILLDDSIISDDIFNCHFCCDLDQCKGACCIEGDAGAPLAESEIDLLKSHLNVVLPYLPNSAVAAINQKGVFELDQEGKKVTPLVDGKECAFVCFESGIAKCAIEKAYLSKKIEFRKPISCHLYPIRIIDYIEFDAINVHKWYICEGAFDKGKKENLPVYVFLRDALIRKYGDNWYSELVRQIENT